MDIYSLIKPYHGVQRIDTVQFSGEFRNPPQIFFAIDYLHLYRGENELRFRCDRNTITTQNFTYTVEQPLNKQVGISYNYYAYDDQRVQVINAFNGIPSSQKSYFIQNVNAQSAILSVTSFGYKGSTNFLLSIENIQANKITIGVKTSNGILSQIGYQILKLIEFIQPTINNLFDVNAIPGNSFSFITSYYGFNFNLNLMQIQSRQVTGYFPNNTFSYTIAAIAPGVLAQCHSLEAFIVKQFKIKFTPLELKSTTIKQKRDPNLNEKPLIIIKFELENKVFTFPEKYKVVVDRSIQEINLQVEINCEKLLKFEIILSEKQSFEFNQKYYINHICNSNFNMISFNIVFKQTVKSYQELEFTMEESRFKIKQILYNYIYEEIDLFDILIYKID